jgi:hypothetical protein
MGTLHAFKAAGGLNQPLELPMIGFNPVVSNGATFNFCNSAMDTTNQPFYILIILF